MNPIYETARNTPNIVVVEENTHIETSSIPNLNASYYEECGIFGVGDDTILKNLEVHLSDTDHLNFIEAIVQTHRPPLSIGCELFESITVENVNIESTFKNLLYAFKSLESIHKNLNLYRIMHNELDDGEVIINGLLSGTIQGFDKVTLGKPRLHGHGTFLFTETDLRLYTPTVIIESLADYNFEKIDYSDVAYFEDHRFTPSQVGTYNLVNFDFERYQYVMGGKVKHIMDYIQPCPFKDFLNRNIGKSEVGIRSLPENLKNAISFELLKTMFDLRIKTEDCNRKV